MLACYVVHRFLQQSSSVPGQRGCLPALKTSYQNDCLKTFSVCPCRELAFSYMVHRRHHTSPSHSACPVDHARS